MELILRPKTGTYNTSNTIIISRPRHMHRRVRIEDWHVYLSRLLVMFNVNMNNPYFKTVTFANEAVQGRRKHTLLGQTWHQGPRYCQYWKKPSNRILIELQYHTLVLDIASMRLFAISMKKTEELTRRHDKLFYKINKNCV